MKFLFSFGYFLIFTCIQAQSLAVKLGYTDDDKLLIVHADDLGVSHSENRATFLAMQTGTVSSASIMMPTPWVEEVASFKKLNPDADLGLHLTLTCEWEYLKWKPVASLDKVRTLVNDKGFFYDNCLEFGQKADPAEAAIELRAQVEHAIKLGIRPTHLDTHMGCLVFNSPEIFGTYLQVGRDYKIPVMVSRLLLQAASQPFKDLITDQDVIIENVYMANEQDYASGLANYYRNTLNSIPSGVHVLLLHLGFDNAEMQAMTVRHEPYGAKWRQQDFDFFTSTECKELLKKNNIKLITWRQIQQVMYPK